MIAAILFLITSIFELSEHFTGITQSAIYTTLPGFLFLIFVYIYNPRFAYSTPVKLYRIIIIHSSGITILKDILSEIYVMDEAANNLMGGFLASMNNIFKEMTKSSFDLEVMKSKNSTLLFSRMPLVTIILEAERSTHMLKNALNEFSLDFSKTFDLELQNFKGDINTFSEYKIILKKYFPFL